MLRAWLAAAAAWRFASLLFQPPRPGGSAELAGLAAELPEALRPGAQAVLQQAPPEAAWEEEYQRVLGPGGCPAVESSYDENVLAGRGPLIADVAAFYTAFGYPSAGRVAQTPDHVAVELDFLSYLAFKVAFAVAGDRHVERDVAMAAYRRFLDEHVRRYLDRLRDEVRCTGSPFYAAAAEWTCLLGDALDARDGG